MRGPYGDGNPASHEAAYSELHTKAEFCGNCHNVIHPANNFRIEDTYTEWKNSPYAEKGIVCQDCHMMPVETAIKTALTMTRQDLPGKASPMGPPRKTVFSHDFVGGNFTVTRLLGDERHASMAEARLKSAAKLTLSAPDNSEPGGKIPIKVDVYNAAAGHNLPTSLTETRQMWLMVEATASDGLSLFSTGIPDPKGDLPEDTPIFGSVALDAEGKPTILPWKMARLGTTKTIPPKTTVETDFTFSVPNDTKGPVLIKASLMYRSLSQRLADSLLGGAAIRVPLVEMAAASRTVNLSRQGR